MSARRLEGKIAAVTGGANGIGRGVCVRFAEEGANIVAVDINKDKLYDTIGFLNNSENLKHLAICGDVSDVAFANRVFNDAKTTYNRTINILVNCAGISIQSFLLNMTPQAFDNVIRVYLREFACSLNLDKNHPKPVSIVNISSIVAKYGNRTISNYCASKAGVIGFTQSVGTELARYGVRCNAVLPGFIKTPMTDKVTERIKMKWIANSSIGCPGTAREVANACLFLASEESSFVNCASLEVTGGYATSL